MSGSTKQSATQTAFSEIKKLIFSGELVAGSNHLESELAERLGISRTPVREATLMLEAHGLLDVQPRKGVRIKSISVEDMANIYEVLTELECLATKRVARQRLGSKELSGLISCIKRMEASLEKEDRDSWAEADDEFHVELLRLGGNNYIEEMVQNVKDQVRRARLITLNLRPSPVESNKDHRELYNALLQGDEDLAQSIHRSHTYRTHKLMIEILNASSLKRI